MTRSPANDDPRTRPIGRVVPNAGGQLDFSQIYGRAEHVDTAIARLLEGRHLLLDEPRRFGKSSFAQLLLHEFSDSGTGSGVYHSVQGDSTLGRFVESVLGALRSVPGSGRNAFARAVGGVLENVTDVKAGPVALGVAYRSDPLAALRTAVASVDKAAEKQDRRLLVCLDELTETVAEIGKTEGDATARALLGELRRFRERHRNVSWIFTGSIGFHHVLRAIGSTPAATGDMQRFALGPLEPAWADWLAGSVLFGAGLPRSAANDPALRAEIVRVTDGIPMLVHMIGEHVRDHDVRVGAEDVPDILERCFRSADRSHNLTHLLTRLAAYYGEAEPAAKVVLDRVARKPLGRVELLGVDGADDALLDSLEADHYLGRDRANRLEWKYPSLARLWIARRGLDA